MPFDLALTEMNGANQLDGRERIPFSDALVYFLRPEDKLPIARRKPGERTQVEFAGQVPEANGLMRPDQIRSTTPPEKDKEVNERKAFNEIVHER